MYLNVKMITYCGIGFILDECDDLLGGLLYVVSFFVFRKTPISLILKGRKVVKDYPFLKGIGDE